MKYISIAVSIIVLVTAVLLMFGVEVQLKPFSVKFTRVMEAIGFIVMLTGLSIYVVAYSKKKVNQELEEIKVQAEQLHEKVKNSFIIPDKDIPNNPFTITRDNGCKYFIVPFPSNDSIVSALWEDSDTLVVDFKKPDVAVFMDVDGNLTGTKITSNNQ